jgi:murein L,D-transpeptidase YcbB/YkuD
VLQSALDANAVEETLARLAPRHDAYRKLREALAEYRRIEREGGWAALPPGPTLRPGDRGERVAALRKRLAVPPSGAFDDVRRPRRRRFSGTPRPRRRRRRRHRHAAKRVAERLGMHYVKTTTGVELGRRRSEIVVDSFVREATASPGT